MAAVLEQAQEKQGREMDFDDAADSPGNNPRILFLIDEIGSITEGGTERQVLQLVHLAARLGYEPHIAVLRGTEWLSEEVAGCPVYLARVGSLFSVSGWREYLGLARWMRRERITLVQTFFVECNIVGPWLARFAGVPVVMGSRRNLNEWHGQARWFGRGISTLQRVANLSADCIVANSQVVVDAVVSTEHAPQQKMRVAYNGIDLEKFRGLNEQRAWGRSLLGLTDDEILVGNISCMRPVKGLNQFVDAARLVLDKDPTIRFVVVGDGIEQAAIIERIARLGLEKQVRLAGAQLDVLPYLAAMDIAVLSSLAEGFSNSLLEYMAAGLPAVATDVGGNREALGDAGILIPPDDPTALAGAILKLRTKRLRTELGRAAQQRVERFSLERAEKSMEELYSEMMKSKGILQ